MFAKTVFVLLAAMTSSPWTMSNAERAAARLDSAKQRARVAADLLNRDRQSAAIASEQCDDVIDGASAPELFFPTELFREMAMSAFVRLPSAFPAIVSAASPDLFRDESDWRLFIEIATPYGELLQREDALALTATNLSGADAARYRSELSTIQGLEPSARANTLKALRARFGRDRFDRMLYEVVGRRTRLCYVDTLGDRAETAIRSVLERERAAE